MAEADVLVVGHTHEPFRVAAPGGGVIVNPGVLLRDGVGTDVVRPLDVVADGSGPARRPLAGTFGVLDLPSRRFRARGCSGARR